MTDRFRLDNKVVVVTGGAGLLGLKHAEAVAEAGGIPVLLDVDGHCAKKAADRIKEKFGKNCIAIEGDVTSESAVRQMIKSLLNDFGHIDVLINNAAFNPKVAPEESTAFTRFENYSLEQWEKELSVGLTGSFICSKAIGPIMADKGYGVITNVSSDLGLIAPDQRIYALEGLQEDAQPVKPVTYSVVKHGIIGLTRYLATYWAHRGVRSNALCPGGVYVDQPDDFVQNLTNLIPLGRMAQSDDYKGAIQFLCSDASAYMNGAIVVIDGGRSCW